MSEFNVAWTHLNMAVCRIVSHDYYKMLSRFSSKTKISQTDIIHNPIKYYTALFPAQHARNLSSTTEQKAAKQAESVRSSTGKELDIARKSPYAGLTMGEKVKEAGKDIYYTGFIIAGLGVLGMMAYYIGSELFSSGSANGVYTKAFKLCKSNTQVIDNFGEPLKGYGEMTRRGRRRHVSHLEYDKEGVKHMRMKFYIEGPIRKGTVNLEVYQNEGRYQYRYMFVELDDNPYRTIIIEDNR